MSYFDNVGPADVPDGADDWTPSEPRSELGYIYNDEDSAGIIYDPEDPSTYIMADDDWVFDSEGLR